MTGEKILTPKDLEAAAIQEALKQGAPQQVPMLMVNVNGEAMPVQQAQLIVDNEAANALTRIATVLEALGAILLKTPGERALALVPPLDPKDGS